MKAQHLFLKLISAAMVAGLLLPGTALAQAPVKQAATEVKTLTKDPYAQTAIDPSTGRPTSSSQNRGKKQDCSNDPKAKNFDPYCDLNRTMK